MDVVRAFVCIHHLEIDEMARDAELVTDAVAAEHVARRARDVERLAAVVALQQARDLDGRRAVVAEPPHAETRL